MRVARVVAIIVALLAATVVTAAPAQAANGSDFDPGFIMSDEVFYDASTMTAAQVQQFLNSKLPRCEAGYTCLKDYTTPTTNKSAVAGRCAGYGASGSQSAATIIFNVAQSCGINPQVLIVLLQKEQGLVTHTAPSSGRYRSATGYGCPDTAACDSTYYGFFNQVYQAAYQFKVYKTAPTYFNFRAGRNNTIGWHPDAACGSSTVYIKNQATAGLYNYTPYRPNAASLGNMYGPGDACSSYGNRNFFAYFTDWFGLAPSQPKLTGSLDSVASNVGEIAVRGWALDPDSTAKVSVHVYVGGVPAAVLATDKRRPDVGAAYPGYGDQRGFEGTVPVTADGPSDVCAYAVSPAASTLLSCRVVELSSGNPKGNVDSISVLPASVRVSGWVLDPETAQPTTAHIYVDGVPKVVTANQPRPDVAQHYPALGANHGFDTVIPLSNGNHSVCVYGINIGIGDNPLLGCREVFIHAGSPIGSLDTVTAVPGGLSLSGWALDPDIAGSIDVHVYVDGKLQVLKATGSRPDVGRAFPVYGSNHGFAATIDVPSGTHNVCAYGINASAGDNALIRCATVTTYAGSPIGYVDTAIAADGRVTLSGWAIDPDTAEPIDVHVYVGGQLTPVTANVSRPDVARAYPDYGPRHGFNVVVSAAPGVGTVCAYGINVKNGTNALLSCVAVSV